MLVYTVERVGLFAGKDTETISDYKKKTPRLLAGALFFVKSRSDQPRGFRFSGS